MVLVSTLERANVGLGLGLKELVLVLVLVLLQLVLTTTTLFKLLTTVVTVLSKLFVPMVFSGEFCPELFGRKPIA